MNLDRDQEPDGQPESGVPRFSKRAARRLIQRAFVLAGRDKHLRQHIREAHLTTRWVLRDWELAWTVLISHGHIEFDRRPAKHPDLTLTWENASDFFTHAETGAPLPEEVVLEGDPALRRFSEPVYKAFFRSLGSVLRYPVDEQGESLL